MNRSDLSPAAAQLIASGFLTPREIRTVAIEDWHRTREARTAIAQFRAEWKAARKRGAWIAP